MSEANEKLVVQTENLAKTYQTDSVETPALRGVDLELNRGEFAALAGPSGSGKSTLLHLVGGLLSPSSGAISLNGHRLNELAADDLAEVRLRELGFVFQAYNLIPVLTVLENAAFVMELQGIASRERRERAMEVLTTLGVDDYADRFPNKLSGGQQQRVAVARAVAPGPTLVLADEPTANLDSETGHNLIELMRELNREREVTFLFATHDDRLLGSVDRVVHMEDGQIARDERRADRPQTPA